MLEYVKNSTAMGNAQEIVKQAIENNIKIVPIPGACAFVNGLIASGMNTKEL